MSTEAAKLRRKAEEIVLGAAASGRDLTEDERSKALGLMAQAKRLEAGEQHVQDIGNGIASGEGVVRGDPGAAFINSRGFKQIQGSRGQTFTTGARRALDPGKRGTASSRRLAAVYFGLLSVGTCLTFGSSPEPIETPD